MWWETLTQSTCVPKSQESSQPINPAFNPAQDNGPQRPHGKCPDALLLLCPPDNVRLIRLLISATGGATAGPAGCSPTPQAPLPSWSPPQLARADACLLILRPLGNSDAPAAEAARAPPKPLPLPLADARGAAAGPPAASSAVVCAGPLGSGLRGEVRLARRLLSGWGVSTIMPSSVASCSCRGCQRAQSRHELSRRVALF